MPYQYFNTTQLHRIRHWMYYGHHGGEVNPAKVVASMFDQPIIAFNACIDLIKMHETRDSNYGFCKNSDPRQALPLLKNGPKFIGYASAYGRPGESISSAWDTKLLPQLFNRQAHCGSSIYSYLAVSCSLQKCGISILDEIHKMTHWDTAPPQYRPEIGIVNDYWLYGHVRLSMVTIHPHVTTGNSDALTDTPTRQRKRA